MINKIIAWLVFVFSLLLLGHPAAAQGEAELQLRLRRNFGYSSLSRNEMQGTFTLSASGPAELNRVVFFIDGQELGTVTQRPFELRFHTGSYSLGTHSLSAVGYTLDGMEIAAKPINMSFVSAETGWQVGLEIAAPLFALIFGVMALSLIITFVGGKKLQNLPPGAPRSYGLAGGAICPRCGRPYPRHTLAPNLLLGKLERCPYCGKWAVVAAASPALLRQAEQNELVDAQPTVIEGESEEDRLRKELDESRYQDW